MENYIPDIYQKSIYTIEYQTDYQGEDAEEEYIGTYVGEETYGAGGKLLDTPSVIETYTFYVRVA